MVKNKIKIAVSSCLLGEAVRYDGTDKHISFITESLAKEYNLISFCPEMAVGMGVPRAPIHLLESEGIIQVVGIEEPLCNMTTAITEYGRKVVAMHNDICGYIFKKNSPSCGTHNVKVMNNAGIYEHKGRGIYAATIMQALPTLPVIDEDDCLNKKAMKSFLIKVDKYSESRE